ncbi:MAG: glycosylase [Cytophaga sp.]|nr:glycosylase [Undibacterium sp.]
MFKWNKLGKVFDPADYKSDDRPWLDEYAQAPATLVFNDFVRVYFSCRPPRGADGQFVSYTAYIDLDRKNLFNVLNVAQNPIMSLGKKGCFDEFGTYPTSVIQNGDELWAYYAGWTRCVSTPFNVGIGLAKSIDQGMTFERLGDGPILPYTLEEPFTISGPKIRKFKETYYLFYVAGNAWLEIDGRSEVSHRIRVATSTDGLNWTRQNQDIIENYWDDHESQASPDVFYANGMYHMFFCGWVPESFRETKARRIGYASSTNLIHWKRDDSKAGITISEDKRAFDNEMVAYPHVFELDGKTYMLYLGNSVGRHGFGLAELEGELS